ncbi:MAG: YihY/virulence factor BrkB family protein [Bacillota bacterium]
MLEQISYKIKNMFQLNWKLFIIKIFEKSRDSNIFVHAMSLVYTTLLSFVPFLIFSFYILTLFNFFGGVENIIQQLQELILNNLAAGTGEALLEYLEKYVTGVQIEQLGVISFITLVVVVIFLLARVEITFNIIWSVEKHRDLFKRFVAFWTFITLGTFIVTLFLSLTFTFLDAYFSPEISGSQLDDSSIFNLITFSLNFFVFIFAYYFIPNTDVEAKSAIFGGIISGTLFILSRGLYSFYTRNIVTYSQIYGSLSMIPIFLIWLYIIWLIALFGAVISNVFQQRDNLSYINSQEQIKGGLQELIPMAILIILYKNFLKQKSRGVEYKELIYKIKLPEREIKERLDKMKEDNLVAETKEGKFIPLTSVKNLSLWSVSDTIIFTKDLQIEKVFNDEEMQQVYKYFEDGLKNNLDKITIEDVVTHAEERDYQ